MADDFVKQVRQGLRHLRAADAFRSVFGAAAHGYDLLPCLTPAEVSAWEESAGVTLPEGYRSFLLEVGNGGAGPFYGLFPLGMWDGAGNGLEPWGRYGAGDLKLPFPHTSSWNLAPARFEPPDLADEDAEEAWSAALEAEYWSTEHIAGSFPLCHQGCAIRNVLVVTGVARGQVWLDARAEQEGIGVGPAFEDWYLSWLAASIEAVEGT